MLSSAKPLAEKALDPLIKPLSKVNPNVLTLLGIIPSILFFVFMIHGFRWYALIALLGTAFDMLDGMVARKYNKTTKFGGLLDSTMDRISDFLIITAFSFSGIIRWEIVTAVLLASYLISYIRSRSESENSGVNFGIGLMERTERLVVIAIGLITYLFMPYTIIYGFYLLEIFFLILLLLSLYTIYQRLVFAYKKL